MAHPTITSYEGEDTKPTYPRITLYAALTLPALGSLSFLIVNCIAQPDKGVGLQRNYYGPFAVRLF
jgi:hypothetical protein